MRRSSNLGADGPADPSKTLKTLAEEPILVECSQIAELSDIESAADSPITNSETAKQKESDDKKNDDTLAMAL